MVRVTETSVGAMGTAVTLENDVQRIVVLPELGGKIWELVHKPTDRQVLWHHPSLPLAPVRPGTPYDDVFIGGWDEIFPSDQAEDLAGHPAPDHGELWSQPWRYEVNVDRGRVARMHMVVDSQISGARFTRMLSVDDDREPLELSYTITNRGGRPLPFLWKVHAAVNIHQGCYVDLGASSVFLERFGTPRTGHAGFEYEWPHALGVGGVAHDMRPVLAENSGVCEFQYATEVREGWCCVVDERSGLVFRLEFDPHVLSSCWVFSTFGGWQDLNVVVLEPCTGYPISVNDGVRDGTHRTLQPGETLSCNVSALIESLGG